MRRHCHAMHQGSCRDQHVTLEKGMRRVRTRTARNDPGIDWQDAVHGIWQDIFIHPFA